MLYAMLEIIQEFFLAQNDNTILSFLPTRKVLGFTLVIYKQCPEEVQTDRTKL